MHDRNRVEREFRIPLEGVAMDGAALGATNIKERYTKRDAVKDIERESFSMRLRPSAKTRYKTEH